MSALIDQKVFKMPSSQDLRLLAALWRGAALEHFSSAECSIIKFFDNLEELSFQLPKNAREQFASSRLEAFLTIADMPILQARAKHAKKSAEELKTLLELRNMLAHATVNIASDQVRYQWYAFEKGRHTKRHLQFAPAEMLEKLLRLEELTKNLASELGQITRHIRITGQTP